MNRKYFLWIILLAFISVLLVASFMWQEKNMQAAQWTQLVQRPASPFPSYISAVGIVEPSSENIFIGSPINRIVDHIAVKVGEKVKEGDTLFWLESLDLKADLLTRNIAYQNAVANLQKLEALPRREDVVAASAALKSHEIELEMTRSQYQSVAGLQNSGAMSLEEVNRRRFAYDQAAAKVQQSKADYDKIKAGAWKPDIEIARLQVMQAEAAVKRVKTYIERTVVRSPIDGTVLQIKIHDGEFPPTDSSRAPAMIVGNTDTMHLRVNVNQFDASFYNSKAPAVAFLQGNAQIEFPLEFVRIEPVFVTKQNITNDISEKIDTRVLQVIYAFKDPEKKVFVGQQMDVFIKNHSVPVE